MGNHKQLAPFWIESDGSMNPFAWPPEAREFPGCVTFRNCLGRNSCLAPRAKRRDRDVGPLLQQGRGIYLSVASPEPDRGVDPSMCGDKGSSGQLKGYVVLGLKIKGTACINCRPFCCAAGYQERACEFIAPGLLAGPYRTTTARPSWSPLVEESVPQLVADTESKSMPTKSRADRLRGVSPTASGNGVDANIKAIPVGVRSEIRFHDSGLADRLRGGDPAPEPSRGSKDVNGFGLIRKVRAQAFGFLT